MPRIHVNRHPHARIHQHSCATSPTYRSWAEMKRRCLNPRAPLFERYGGRSITVCARWMLFDGFLEDMGLRPPGMTLERNDNDGNYEPGNVRWATAAEQARNTSRNVWVEANGERLCVADWAARLGVAPPTVRKRLRNGWDPVRAVTEPAHENRRTVRRWRSPI